MRIIISTLTAAIAAGLILYPAPLQAQGADAPERIAVIDMQTAIGSTQDGKLASQNIRNKYGPKQKQLQDEEAEIEKLQNQLQNQSSMLTAAEQYQLSRQLAEDQRHYKDDSEDDQDNFQADTQEAIQKIGAKMTKIITQYAKQHGYDMVIGEGTIPVYYVAKAYDITQDIVKLYDATYPGPAATAASSKPPGAAAKPAQH